ncbi:hypothetical protein V8G54_035716 [Vigna mungo]|uniref:Uncharacterized protein n=1 Tax=Vigna mungo TaxID=3915 RepID=A0AAQ3MFJ9_VIGMU
MKSNKESQTHQSKEIKKRKETREKYVEEIRSLDLITRNTTQMYHTVPLHIYAAFIYFKFKKTIYIHTYIHTYIYNNNNSNNNNHNLHHVGDKEVKEKVCGIIFRQEKKKRNLNS